MSESDSKLMPETVPITDWWVFRRVQEVKSAVRVNWVRAAALVLLYAAHWVAYLTRKVGSPGEQALLDFHESVHWLALAGLLVVVAVAVCLRNRALPPLAKYLSTTADVALVTAVAAVGQKAQSGMVVCYLLIIAMAFLRFSQRHIVTTVVACVIGYLFLVGLADAAWFDSEHVTPVARQLTMLFTMCLAGCVGWQMCSTVRAWVEREAEPLA